MKKTLQHPGWISGTRQRAVNAALALAVLIVPMLVLIQSVQAQSFSVLYSFTPFDGEGPKSSLVLDKEGNLYGTAGFGAGSFGWGDVFKLDRSGTETLLHSFTGPDGIDPTGGLVRDQEGNLYGTAANGGTAGGTVFKLDTTNTVTVLHNFTGPDGATPLAGLVRDRDENLYGTTQGGGASGRGTVFKLDTTGTETVLYSFSGGADGADPLAGLVRDKEGNLYGTTPDGGASGLGTVFKVNATGTETVLHSFTGPDGANPNFAGLVRDKEGNLYGTTLYGGDLLSCRGLGCGVVFKVGTADEETVLHSFTGGADGANPAAGLVLDKEGNLYGTTSGGGTSNQGTVFKLDTTGTETVLHSFTGADGGGPEASLILDKEGNNLYGTTDVGTSGVGTVFKIRLKAPHRER